MIKEKADRKISVRLPESLYAEVLGYADSFGLSFAEALKLILKRGLQVGESQK